MKSIAWQFSDSDPPSPVPARQCWRRGRRRLLRRRTIRRGRGGDGRKRAPDLGEERRRRRHCSPSSATSFPGHSLCLCHASAATTVGVGALATLRHPSLARSVSTPNNKSVSPHSATDALRLEVPGRRLALLLCPPAQPPRWATGIDHCHSKAAAAGGQRTDADGRSTVLGRAAGSPPCSAGQSRGRWQLQRERERERLRGGLKNERKIKTVSLSHRRPTCGCCGGQSVQQAAKNQNHPGRRTDRLTQCGEVSNRGADDGARASERAPTGKTVLCRVPAVASVRLSAVGTKV